MSASSSSDVGPGPAKQPRMSESGDIADYLKKPSKDITDAIKYQLADDHFIPDPTHVFPRSSNGRCFQHRWLHRYPWLVYSKNENGGFCLPCVLFSRGGNLRSDPGILVQRPLTNFTKALELLDKHTAKSYHKTAVVRFDDFVKVMRGQQPNICQRLDKVAAARIASNRQKLRSIVETIVLCGRQNISLCGHRDSALDVERDATASHGNFRALLEFRVAAGDSVLRDHLATAARNATYTSADIQNQVIAILGGHQVRR